MAKQLTLGSLFSGSGGFELGGSLCGIKPVWNSEVEPYAIAVTKKHFPDVLHLGDINQIDGAKIPPVDIITGGFCCQDLSVAGRRAGIHGERSGLFFQMTRIIREMLNATNKEYPKYLIFENVPGLLSSNKGGDFREVMDEISSLGFLVDPNILDAQEFGVAQRRKRVYLTCANINYTLQKRTILSESITLALLTQLSLTALAGRSAPLGIEPQNWALNEKSLSEDGLHWKMNTFSLTSEQNLSMLQNILDGMSATFPKGQENSECIHGNDQAEKISSMPEDMKLGSSETENHQFMHTGLSLKKCLEDALEALKLSTTSTATKETIIRQICISVQTLRSINEFTTRYLQSLTSPNAADCFEWVKSSFAEQRGYIKNARKTNDGFFKSVAGYDILRDYEQSLSTCENDIEFCIAARSEPKILPILQSLSGHTPQGIGQRQGTAGDTSDCTGDTGCTVLNDQGGSRMDVTDDVTSTLRAEAHHPPCVVEASGFCTEHSAQSRGVGFEKERSPTLRACVVPDVAIENHPADSRMKINEYGIVQTLSGRMGTGGNNVPLTLKIRSGCEGGGKGALIQEDQSATLSTVNDQSVFVPFRKGTRPHNKDEGQKWEQAETANTLNTFDTGENRCNELAVKAYGICSQASNAMQSDNPHSGIYEAETARTLDASGGNPTCNQGGIAVCVQGSMIGRKEENGPNGSGINVEKAFTLDTVSQHAVAYAMTTGSYAEVHEERAATLMARDYKDPQTTFVPQVVNQPQYLVRRLTPTECASLQGFPADWCARLETPEPTEEDISFWTDVFDTYARINGKKPKTRNQIVKWLQNPHTDSAEYKMWGNGVALPCVCFVMAGIVYFTQMESTEKP